jgi:hypothetical protein
MRPALTLVVCNLAAKASPPLWMSREEARAVVEAELRALNLTTPMTAEELDLFCKDVCKRLNFALTKEDCRKRVLIWAEHWQALWL